MLVFPCRIASQWFLEPACLAVSGRIDLILRGVGSGVMLITKRMTTMFSSFFIIGLGCRVPYPADLGFNSVEIKC